MRILNKQANDILKTIEEYENIFVFRHDSPDYDALGTQFGLVTFLKDNFPNKNIYAPGFSNVILADGLYPNNDKIDEKLYNQKFLAIVVDTANKKRVSDQHFLLADKIIKIDHHPAKENYGHINLVRDQAGAASELLYCLLKTKPFRKYKISKETAKYLYSGIVGDTGRFQFSSTTYNTLKCGAELTKYGFDFAKEVYYPMYKKSIKDFECIQFVMNHYSISEHGVAYYTLYNKDLKKLGIDCDEAKSYLHLFSNYDEIKVWVCLVEDKRQKNFRGSIRSRDVIVNEVCSNFNGGGHAFASGTRMKDYPECLKLIEALDKAVIEQGK